MTLPNEVDVLVLGFGAAGAGAALQAHESGASVAIVEKTGAGGGNCVHSGGFLFEIDGATAVDHLDALCFGKTDPSVLAAFAGGLCELVPWLSSLGGRIDPVAVDAFGGMLPSWPHFPGAGHVHYHQYAGQPPGASLWAMLQDAVAQRQIPVALGCPALELIDDGAAVTGAVVSEDGRRREIHARGGVVLACGGMEYDAELRDTYLPLTLVPVGHAGNTGDAIRLATGAGASLWHMSAFFGWLAFVAPEFAAGFPLDVHAPSFLLVDADGHRFADETGWEVHDKVRSLTAYLPRRPNRPRMPGFVVFDEAARLAGPLNGIVGTPNDYVWSADNSAEIERGWIKRADSAAGLAEATGLDPATLAETLDAYARATHAGQDEEFGRSAQTLVELSPPLYAIEFRPGLATASGGPRRDAEARVLRPGGEPIEGLYAAGAAGSIWGHLTEHGGGLGDALVFGRIAGSGGARRAARS
jgi:succinate dehydrogenase/fumarate reductase flavoprotein subunit